MILNARGLEYPLNLYCDISEFKEEDEARCYYYHKTADRLPPDIFETMEYLLKEYFNGRDGRELIRGIYERGEKMPENETARTVISRFFRDMLYYPQYNELLNFGNNPDKLKETEEKRQAFIKEQFKGRENVFMPDLKKQGLLSGKTDAVLKKHAIRDLKTLIGLSRQEISFYFRGDAEGLREVLNLIESQGLKSFALKEASLNGLIEIKVIPLQR